MTIWGPKSLNQQLIGETLLSENNINMKLKGKISNSSRTVGPYAHFLQCGDPSPTNTTIKPQNLNRDAQHMPPIGTIQIHFFPTKIN